MSPMENNITNRQHDSGTVSKRKKERENRKSFKIFILFPLRFNSYFY